MRQRQVTLQAAEYRWGREYAWISSCKLACYRSKYLSGKEKKKKHTPTRSYKVPKCQRAEQNDRSNELLADSYSATIFLYRFHGSQVKPLQASSLY